MLITDFLEHIELIEGLTNNTAKKYKTNLDLFKDWLDKDVDDISYSDLLHYIKHLKNDGLKGSTINNKIVTLKKFYSFLYDIDLINSNPSKKLSTIKVKNKDNNFKRTISDDEMKNVMDYLANDKQHSNPIRNHLIFKIFTTLGLRLNELRNIKISDIDFDNKMVRVMRKGREEQYLPLNDSIIELINDYIDIERYNADTDYLFISRQKNQLSRRSLQSMVKKVLSKFVDDKDLCHAHTLRHWCLSKMLRNGNNVNVVKEIGNHKDISTTQLYLHNEDDDIRNAIESF